MSEPTNAPGGTQAPTASAGPEAHNAALRVRGRSFLMALSKALRSIKLYPSDNAQVRGSLDELASTTSDILAVDGALDVRTSNEILYVNDVRLRLEVDNFASFGHVISTCSKAGIGVQAPPPRRWRSSGSGGSVWW